MWSALASGLLLTLGVAGYALAAVRAGWPAGALIAGVPLVYAAVVALFVAWYFAMAWIWRSPRPAHARIGAAATLRLVWDEYRALFAAPWRMLLYRVLVPAPAPGPATGPVLLLHGVLCNAGVWARMVRHLARAGVRPVYALSYGPPLASIELFAEQVHAMVERIRRETGAGQVTLVAHSMGGLVALAYLRRYGTAHVRRLVTIGTPWQGSAHAHFFVGTSIGQLRPSNAWLAELAPRAPAGGPPVVSIWSWHDSMVAPQTSSQLQGATNVALVGIGHNALLAAPRVLARVADECAAASSYQGSRAIA